MKLQCVHDGAVYATAGRQIYRERAVSVRKTGTLLTDQAFQQVGTLPIAIDGITGLTERVQTTTPWKSLLESVVGTYQTVNLWVFSHSALLATAGRHVFVSDDGGQTWEATLSLPASSGRMGVLPSSVCRDDGTTYLAEYPLDEGATPRVHRSPDDGWTWETVLEWPEIRHVHSISVDPYGGDRWLTTGDRDDACRLVRLRDESIDVVGGGSQDWRIVEPAFTRDAIVWGVDCGYAEENRIYRLPRSALDEPTPTPEHVCTLSSSVYYAETLDVGDGEWVVFSTAAERGDDRTAPDKQVGEKQTAEVVAASTESGLEQWHTLERYHRRTTPGDWGVSPAWLPAANAYVFLASCPDRGLFYNSYNTARDDGAIRRRPLSTFRELGPQTDDDSVESQLR